MAESEGTDVLNLSEDELSISNPAKKTHKQRDQLGGKFGILGAEGGRMCQKLHNFLNFNYDCRITTSGLIFLDEKIEQMLTHNWKISGASRP